MDNKKLNNMVVSYQQTNSDELFSKIYRELGGWWSNKKTIAQSILSNEHEVEALYADTLMKAINRYNGKDDFFNFYKKAVVLERANLYRKNKRRSQQEVYEKVANSYDGEDFEDNLFANFESSDNTENSVLEVKKEDDQRQLIDFLLNGADVKTTAIVKTFLNHPKPTPTAIGKALGLHHSTVIRALEKLAGKFDSKQYGDYRDYLVAY
jgi:DNA-directed RNA polymerase specialized sigma24 family protein